MQSSTIQGVYANITLSNLSYYGIGTYLSGNSTISNSSFNSSFNNNSGQNTLFFNQINQDNITVFSTSLNVSYVNGSNSSGICNN